MNDKTLLKKFKLFGEFGTNLSDFFNKKVGRYQWIYKEMNTILAKPLLSLLSTQVLYFDKISMGFNTSWRMYQENLQDPELNKQIKLVKIPDNCEFDALMFWIKVKNNKTRNKLEEFLKDTGIISASHFYPLHVSQYGGKVGEFIEYDVSTTSENELLLRPSLYYHIAKESVRQVVKSVRHFYKSKYGL